MGSLGFSTFKSFWNEALAKENLEKKIRSLVQGGGFLLYFKIDKDVFGAGEDGRIVFARMKNPNPDEVDGWNKEASFSALNLSRLLKGEGVKSIFTNKDLKKIKVIDEDRVIALLVKQADGVSHIPTLQAGMDHEPDNFIKTQE